MSESIVERVARAICAAEALYDPDEIGDHGGNEANWKFHVAEARAAIAALREPTRAMLDACWGSAWRIKREDSRESWQAMIDAALRRQEAVRVER